MGELIKELGEVRFANENFKIEENESSGLGTLIHFQNSKLRYEMSSQEFITFVGLILEARESLVTYKKT